MAVSLKRLNSTSCSQNRPQKDWYPLSVPLLDQHHLIALFQDKIVPYAHVSGKPSPNVLLLNKLVLEMLYLLQLLLVLQRDFTSAAPATGQGVACDGSNRRRSCGVADRR